MNHLPGDDPFQNGPPTSRKVYFRSLHLCQFLATRQNFSHTIQDSHFIENYLLYKMVFFNSEKKNVCGYFEPTETSMAIYWKASINSSRLDIVKVIKFVMIHYFLFFWGQGLRLKKQHSTGELEKRGTSASIRSTGSSASWMSTESSQSAMTNGSQHTDSNASFIAEVYFYALVVIDFALLNSRRFAFSQLGAV